MEIEKDLKEELLKSNVKINKIKTNSQLYNDKYGDEVIENLIGYLGGEDLLNRRISQEIAIQKHTELMEFKNSYKNTNEEEDLKLIRNIQDLENKAHTKIPLKESVDEENDIKNNSHIMKKKKFKTEL